jgi:hypothetical protein
VLQKPARVLRTNTPTNTTQKGLSPKKGAAVGGPAPSRGLCLFSKNLYDTSHICQYALTAIMFVVSATDGHARANGYK